MSLIVHRIIIRLHNRAQFLQIKVSASANSVAIHAIIALQHLLDVNLVLMVMPCINRLALKVVLIFITIKMEYVFYARILVCYVMQMAALNASTKMNTSKIKAV